MLERVDVTVTLPRSSPSTINQGYSFNLETLSFLKKAIHRSFAGCEIASPKHPKIGSEMAFLQNNRLISCIYAPNIVFLQRIE